MKITLLKRLLAPLLCVAILTAAPAFAATTEAQPDNVMVYGVLSKLDNNQLELKNNDTNDPYKDIILTVDDNTLILDAVNGTPVALAAVKEGQTAYAYVNNYMTMSLPPHAGAQLLLVNIPADYAVPTYLQVTGVTTEGDKTIVSTDRQINLNITKDCTITPYLTKNIVTVADLTPGTRLLAWYDVVLTTYPGQAAPTKVLVFPYQYRGALEVTNAEAMLPLRATCAKFDLSCKWDQAAKSAVISSGDQVIATFTLGKDTAKAGSDEIGLTTPLTSEKGQLSISAQDAAAFLNLYIY